MIPPPDLALLDSAAKDALIRTLIERLNDLMVRLEVLEAENAALRKGARLPRVGARAR